MAKPTPVAKPAEITETAVEGIFKSRTEMIAYMPQTQIAIILLASVKLGLPFTTTFDL